MCVIKRKLFFVLPARLLLLGKRKVGVITKTAQLRSDKKRNFTELPRINEHKTLKSKILSSLKDKSCMILIDSIKTSVSFINLYMSVKLFSLPQNRPSFYTKILKPNLNLHVFRHTPSYLLWGWKLLDMIQNLAHESHINIAKELEGLTQILVEGVKWNLHY
jgi:hypothetical protein